jgi:biotin operon repressor
MTTNVYSSSTANDKRDLDDSQSSNEIRADIDQTRASVGEKIDQLQARPPQ